MYRGLQNKNHRKHLGLQSRIQIITKLNYLKSLHGSEIIITFVNHKPSEHSMHEKGSEKAP